MGLLQRIQNWLWPTNGRTPVHYDLYEQLRLVEAHLRAERYESARAVLLSAAKLRPSFADPRVASFINSGLAITWLADEEFDAAIAYFCEYIARYPSEFEPYHYRAMNFWYVGRLAEAVADYSRALELKPSDPSMLSARGQTYAESGEFDKAMGDLDGALRELRNSPSPIAAPELWSTQIEAYTRNGRALALGGLGETKRAMEEFESSAKLAGENAWLYFNRAQIQERLGDSASAAEDYRRALEKTDPKLTPLKRARALSRLAELSKTASG
jgi:tetratricopeptide (TPR) repeat protein